MNKKRWISVVVAAALCAGSFPTAVMAAEDPYKIVVMPKLTSDAEILEKGKGAGGEGKGLGVVVI